MRIFRRSAVLIASAAVGALVLAGCSSDGDTDSATTAADSIVVTDQWAKAADSGMTAVFGTLENTSGEDIQITSGSTPASNSVELHEVADGVMQEKDGGFVIPAGGSHTLAPGADHIMLMGLTGPVEPGSDVEVTLTFSDGSTSTFEAQAREFSGNQEDYVGDKDMDMDGGMSPSGMDNGS